MLIHGARDRHCATAQRVTARFVSVRVLVAVQAAVLGLCTAFANAGVIQEVKALTGTQTVKLVLKADSALDPKVFTFEEPLRLAIDLSDTSVSQGLFPVVLTQPPVAQVLQTSFGKNGKNTRIEVILSDQAEYSLVNRDGVLTLDLKVGAQTKQVEPAYHEENQQVIQLERENEARALAGISADDVEFRPFENSSTKPGKNPVAKEIDATYRDLHQDLTDATGRNTGTAVTTISGADVARKAQEDASAAGGNTPPADNEVDFSGFVPVDVTDQSPSVQPGSADAPKADNLGSLRARDPLEPGSDVSAERAWATYMQGSDFQTLVGTQQYSGDPVTLNLKNADLLDVLRQIADITGFNIVLDPGVRGLVTIRLENVPWDQALDIILRNNGLGRTFEGNVMRVASLEKLKQEELERLELQRAKETAAPIYTEVVYISYAKAGDLATIIRNNLSPRGFVINDERTNAMLISDIRERVENIKRYIRVLDRRTRQVSINARIVTATKSFTRNLGLSYSFRYFGDAAHGSNTRMNFPYNYSVASAVNMPGPTVPQIASVNFGDILDTTFLNLAVAAAESAGTGKVIANPKIITSDNEQATIRSGIQVPYILAQGDIQVPTGGGGTVDAGTTQFIQFQNVEVSLNVRPQITNDDFVDLTITVNNNSLGSGTPPSININNANTKVLVKDGDTFVIGGFKQVNMTDNEDKIPGAADVPVIGWFFKARNKSQTLSDLLFFITPNILKDEQRSLKTVSPEGEESEVSK